MSRPTGKRSLAATAAAALLLGLFASVNGGQASGAVRSSTVTFGTVTNAAGDPVAGASVSLVPDRMAMPGPGDTATFSDVASDVTDANGHYTLNLPANFTGQGVTDPGTGLIAFNILVNGPGVHTMTAFDASLASATAARRVRSLTRTDFTGRTVAATDVDPTAEATLDFTDTTPSPDQVITYPDQSDPVDSGGGPDVTVVRLIKNYGKRWTAVGAWFSNTPGVNADFVYGTGASSSLGVGVSASGEFGSFHAGSTHSESTTASQGFPIRSARQNLLYRSLFTYKLYRYQDCYAQGCAPPTFKAVATNWAGGADLQQSGNPGNIDNCVPEPKGGYWSRSNTEAITWTNGVAIGKVIGIDLSAQTGFSSNATQRINFTEGGHWLCGRFSAPGVTPRVLMARP